MANSEKVLSYTAAVKGFQKKICVYTVFMKVPIFTTKLAFKAILRNGTIVWALPKCLSQVAKFVLDWGHLFSHRSPL